MGKGDRRTRKGKISIRSYGNKRPHSEGGAPVVAKPATSKPAVVSRPAAKKAAPVAAKKKA
jgi:ribosomal small subunit protein bTHX